MKRQGQRQTRLEDYFGKRARVEADAERQKDSAIVVATGKTALQMIAEAYEDVDEEHEEQEQSIDDANDNDYCRPPRQTEQIGGAHGFSSSDEQSTDVDDSDSEVGEAAV